MRKYLFLLLILGVLAACSSNRVVDTEQKKPCNEINLEKAIEQTRAQDKANMYKLQGDLDNYRENIFMAVKELESLRKELEELLNTQSFLNPDRESQKNYVTEDGKDVMEELNSIKYRDKLEQVKNHIADIEKFMRENCYGYKTE
jgi:predicted  nucleic acid-binding Zn-ribbon protein